MTTTAGPAGISLTYSATYSASGPGARDTIRLMFGPEVADHDIDQALRDAVHDLNGSVARGSLIEMAVRLAVVRLDRDVRGRRPPVSVT